LNQINNEDRLSRGVYILPKLDGLGGPASFRGRLVRGFSEKQVVEVDSIDDPRCQAVLVIGGTRDLATLFKAKSKGLRIVQRLNGMNWIHRKMKVPAGYFFRCEVNNLLLRFIRGNMANHVVYQSQFASKWWQTVFGPTRVPSSVVYNGVDLTEFSPQGPEIPPGDHYRLLMIEAQIGGGYESGLDTAVKMTQLLNQKMDKPVRLIVAGNVWDHIKTYWSRQSGGMVDWVGIVPNDQIASLDRSAHLLFSADLNAACPNAVIEALACGLPVLAYATGSLPEIITGNAGQVVPYGSNYWNLEKPDIQSLAKAGVELLTRQEEYRKPARRKAEESFGLDRMVDHYLAALFN
jgi:glycosyltransferase involved in cell wall biosynthesis